MFSGRSLTKNRIELNTTEAFLNFRVLDQPSRLLPVFINLVNNSIYWVGTSNNERREILFDVATAKVVVADSGPGVAPEDVDNLFKLFFTRKILGGRGVGLYLAKANLVSGGHSISYAADAASQLLPGANFLIELNGAEFKDG